MKSPFIVAYWEGGSLTRVSFREWWNFIWSSPEKLIYPNPRWALQPYQYKCYAGINLGLRTFGFDFIIGRKWREWEADRQQSLKKPDCPEGEEYDPNSHCAYKRDSKPFTYWLAWRASGRPE